MAKCSPSTLVIGRPTQGLFNQLSSSPKCGLSQSSATVATSTVGSCANNGATSPFDCCDKSSLGSRTSRDLVREKIKDYVLLKLGAPVIDLELDDQQVQLAIDEALYVVEEFAPREFFSYHTFMTTPGKSVYELPPNVGYVRNIFYKTTGNLPFNTTGLDGSIPLEFFWSNSSYLGAQGGFIDPSQPIWGRAGEWTLFKQYSQMYNRLSSQLGGWEWVGGNRHIKLYPIPCGCQEVIVHYIQRCKDWNCMTQAMAEGALAFSMMMLAEIRSKYQNIPGPQGGVILNGQDLMQRGMQMKEKWEERLLNRWGDILPLQMG